MGSTDVLAAGPGQDPGDGATGQPAEPCWCRQATVDAFPLLGAVLVTLLLLDRWSRRRAKRRAQTKTGDMQKHGEMR